MNSLNKLHGLFSTITAILKQTDYDKLMGIFFQAAIRITNSDKGNLYVRDGNHYIPVYEFNYNQNPRYRHDDESKVAIEDNGSLISKCFLNQESSNIENQTSDSILIVPIKDGEGKVVAVLHLANGKNSSGEIVPFSALMELTVSALASITATAISNIANLQETKDLLYSIISVTATAIDERSPFNANHTRNMVRYIADFIDYLNRQYQVGLFDEYFDDNRKEQLLLAAHLHDIGKIVTPLNIMNKSTRLGYRIKDINYRFKLMKSYLKIELLEGKLTNHEYVDKKSSIDKAFNGINMINQSTRLTEDHIQLIEELSSLTYTYEDEIYPYIEQEEKECLLITRGTLTEAEREVMKNHIHVTNKLLEKIRFNKYYENVPIWASMHHEFLDGSGYPMQLTGQNLPIDARILVIMDIFESLTAVDRPYKDPIPLEEAYLVLDDMVAQGKLDERLVSLLKASYQERGD